MTALAFISRWIISGGWKIVGGAFLVIGCGLFIGRAVHWKEEAARAQILDSQLVENDRRAHDILNRFAEAEQKRGAAESALSAWQSHKSVTLEPIRNSGRHASASTDPACLPSAADRSLRNDAIQQLLGPAGNGG